MNYFEYEDVAIETHFKLSEEQDKALKELIHHVLMRSNKPITLSGFAGVGKSSLIKYLELYLEKRLPNKFNFVYAAPTHAATVYLGLNLGYLPYTIQSIIVTKYDNKYKEWVKCFSSKFLSAINQIMYNILVVDESSMLSCEDVFVLSQLAEKSNIQLIFLGDKAQLPEITTKKHKTISPVFTDFKQVKLTKVQRTNDNDILKVLTEIRTNPNGILPIVPNTERLKYYDRTQTKEFYDKFIEKFNENNQGTVMISYTNSFVKDFNKRARKTIFGDDTDGLNINEIIVGYGGYNNKQVNGYNLANSIKYRVTEIEEKDSFVIIKGVSDVVTKINPDIATTRTNYLQLSEHDSIVIDKYNNLEAFEKNNKIVSTIFKQLYVLKKKVLLSNKWVEYFKSIEQVTSHLKNIDLGSAYIYIPEEDRMYLYDNNNEIHREVKKTFPELYIDKGIDYGYAITIHKSQGATYENVFFNAISTENNNCKIYELDEVIGTEGNALNYVGMSRASKELHVYHGNKVKEI